MMMKIAYFCEPHVGGTFRFFLNIRPPLARLGVEFVCLPPLTAVQLANNPWAQREGVQTLSLPEDLCSATQWLNEYLRAEGFSCILILPGCDVLSSSLPVYVNRSVRTMARVPVMTQGAYRPLNEMRAHINRVVAVCPRIANDLMAGAQWAGDEISVVPNGVQLCFKERVSAGEAPLRVLYAGRIEDLQKNVMLLPEILEKVWRRHPEIHLSVVGDGPDLTRLKGRFARTSGGARVLFHGMVPPEDMADFYRQSDVLVLPTRYEGSSNTLLEAMAMGCIPLVSQIKGVTDVVVEQGLNGWCFPVGDADGFVDAIIQLAEDERLRKNMSHEARLCVEGRFTLEKMAEGYQKSFFAVLNMQDARPPALPLSGYRPLSVLRPSWRRYVPVVVKNRIRNFLERRGKSL